jgi:signal transduction histidine kinase
VFKLWGPEGELLYSTSEVGVGQKYPVEEDLSRAWWGHVTSAISDLDEEENAAEGQRWTRLIETYSPVRRYNTDEIVAVAEFYQTVDSLQQEINAAQRRSWLVVLVATALMYLLLIGFVRRSSDTIERQQNALRDQVTQLTELLTQNKSLGERVRRAAAHTSALNERVLRRISAELHDGPAQYISLALLRLDTVIAHAEARRTSETNGDHNGEDLEVIQSSLRHALEEVRAISSGMGVPQLSNMTPAEILRRVVRVHEQRTGTKVALSCEALPDEAPLPVKIALYRLVQEALNNAYRHAQGVGQQVRVSGTGHELQIQVADQGPGFDGMSADDEEKHLGLVGMRERVESLGGHFWIESQPGQGTTVNARLSLQAVEALLER